MVDKIFDYISKFVDIIGFDVFLIVFSLLIIFKGIDFIYKLSK